MDKERKISLKFAALESDLNLIWIVSEKGCGSWHVPPCCVLKEDILGYDKD